jgi:bifunctional DNA-binding transcriptional regulator/antitoxin component of YhaV-PrlF toxin-antitoxin module
MSQIQTLTLKVNPKNGTVVIPKKIRDEYNIYDSLLIVMENNKLEILANKYTADEVLEVLPALKSNKTFSDQDFKKVVEDGIIENYKKSL